MDNPCDETDGSTPDRMRHVSPKLVLVLATAAHVLSATPASAGMTRVDWSSFDKMLWDDCDTIDVKIEPNVLPSSIVQLVLSSDPQITWFKGITFYDAYGGQHMIGIQDTTKQASVSIAAGLIPGGHLGFEKAKLAGYHTGVYELDDLSRIAGGSRVTFNWIQDQCPNFSAGFNSTTVPTWLLPNETRTFQITVQNWGDAWRADSRLELVASTRYFDWQVKPVPVTATVPRFGSYTFDVTVTAPAQLTAYALELYIHQRGGVFATGDWQSAVQISRRQPLPPPPPTPPALIVVPNVVHLSAADAAKAVIDSGLNYQPIDLDPLNPNKTVAYQYPLAGDQLGAKTAIYVAYAYGSPDGFSNIDIYNCEPGTVVVYSFDGDRWNKAGDVASQIGDNGQCPTKGKPFEESLEDSAINYYVVVDPTKCSDPGDTACRIYEWMGWGDKSGPTFSGIAP
jgi:hypothetical protein